MSRLIGLLSIIISLTLFNQGLAQDASKKPEADKLSVAADEIEAAQNKYDKTVATLTQAYIAKQIAAKKTYVTSMVLIQKSALRAKQIDEANLINLAMEAAKEEISSLSPRAKDTPLDFKAGAKGTPAFSAAKSALKRHDVLIGSARKFFDKGYVTALKQHLRDLDKALLKPAIAGNLENATAINSAKKEVNAKLESVMKKAAVSKGRFATMLPLDGGKIIKLDVGANRFSDRTIDDHKWGVDGIAQKLNNGYFIRSSITKTSARCTRAGLVYVLTVAKTTRTRGKRGSLQKSLSLSGFTVAIPPQSNEAYQLVVMKKYMKVGEILSFGLWGVIICGPPK